MKIYSNLLAMMVLLFFALSSCSNSTSSGGEDDSPSDIIMDDDERILIVDRTGEEWDITHAVKEYGFEPSKFQFGGGANSIPPILNPQFLLPEDQGYPPVDHPALVIGYEANNDARAYALSAMRKFEVANDMFGDTAVAVGY